MASEAINKIRKNSETDAPILNKVGVSFAEKKTTLTHLYLLVLTQLLKEKNSKKSVPSQKKKEITWEISSSFGKWIISIILVSHLVVDLNTWLVTDCLQELYFFNLLEKQMQSAIDFGLRNIPLTSSLVLNVRSSYVTNRPFYCLSSFHEKLTFRHGERR